MSGEKNRDELVQAIQSLSESDNLIVASFIAGMKAEKKLASAMTACEPGSGTKSKGRLLTAADK